MTWFISGGKKPKDPEALTATGPTNDMASGFVRKATSISSFRLALPEWDVESGLQGGTENTVLPKSNKVVDTGHRRVQQAGRLEVVIYIQSVAPTSRTCHNTGGDRLEIITRKHMSLADGGESFKVVEVQERVDVDLRLWGRRERIGQNGG